MNNNTFEKSIISFTAEGMAQESLKRGMTPTEQYFLPKDISDVLMEADDSVSDKELECTKNYIRGLMEVKMINYASKIFTKIKTNADKKTEDEIPDIVA